MKKIFFIISLMLSVTLATAQDTAIDAETQMCLGKAQHNADLTKCQIIAQEKWTMEVNKYYKLYRDKLISHNKIILDIAQFNWENYRNSQFNMIEAQYLTQASGQMWKPVIEEKKAEIIRARALDLHLAYDDISELR